VAVSPHEPAQAHPPRFLLKRLAMAGATAFLAINIWTGAPLVALWVGSQVVGKTVLSMKAVFVVVIVLAVLVYGMALALARLNAAYDRLIGRPPPGRLSWMRSMGAADEKDVHYRVGVTALEQIVMASVYLAVICFVVWFLFLAHYSFGG
jgi:hypothetical protein